MASSSLHDPLCRGLSRCGVSSAQLITGNCRSNPLLIMLCVCLNCGKTDEVIGNDAPLCLTCGTPLIKATQSYRGLLMSPEVVLRRMQTVVEKHGIKQAETGRFKQEREAWTSAVYSLALSQLYGKQYWIEIETVEQTPDTRLHHINQTTGNNVDEFQNIEVVDWESHVDDVMTLIRAKCQKAYGNDFCLLVTVRSGKLTYSQVIAHEIRSLSVPFAEIWIVGIDAGGKAHVDRVHPDYTALEFAIPDVLAKVRTEVTFLQRQQRGTGTEFVPLGHIFLPIR